MFKIKKLSNSGINILLKKKKQKKNILLRAWRQLPEETQNSLNVSSGRGAKLGGRGIFCDS